MDILIEEKESSLWVAALDKGVLQGLEVDPAYEEVRAGSVYWGRVESIDASMDAAYVNLDGDNFGLLNNADILLRQSDGTLLKGGAKSIGKTISSGQMIAVQAKSGYVPQITHGGDGHENKLVRLSMNITMPGRYLIYCPMMQGNRLSQRVRDKALRKQILAMSGDMLDMEGFILRAAAANTQSDVLVREGKILIEAYEQMSHHLTGEDPSLIMSGADAIQRTLSDQAAMMIDRIEVVTLDHYNHVEEWCSIFAPDLVPKVDPIELDNATIDWALFDYRDIIGQIEALFQSYALLPGGGNIIIQETAALTAIDVNRGADKSSGLSINLDAAKEIARQIRVRNLGGIIMVDFLKSKNKKENGQLIACMEKEIAKDPCTVQIHGLTALGLLEMTRTRRTPPLDQRTNTDFSDGYF